MQDIPFNAILKQEYGTYKGYFAENYVAQQFVASGCEGLYSWGGRNSEIEFLKIIDDTIVPVEVKSGTRTKSKSFKTFCDKYAPEKRVKITANEFIKKDDFLNYPLYLAGMV